MSDFKSDLDADLSDVFMNKDEFAEEVTYTPKAAPGSPYTINGIFDNEFESVDPDTNAPIISTQPNLRIKEADLQAPAAPGDLVTIRSIEYKVIEPETDGVGTTVLLLHKNIVIP